MQFSPKTEKEVTEANLLPVGFYPFTVQVAMEKTSKLKPDGSGGNPMIELQLEVFDEDGKGHRIKDFLMESVPHKLRHFAYAVGLGARYEAGEMHSSEMQGLSGKCLIRIEPAKDGYSARNSVKDYVKAEEQKPAVPSRPVGGGASSSDPPFMRLGEW